MSFIYSCSMPECEKQGKNPRHFAQCRGCHHTFCREHADEDEQVIQGHLKHVQEQVDPEIKNKLTLGGKHFKLFDRFLCLDCWNRMLASMGVIGQ